MRKLYGYAIRNLEANWPMEYQAICEKVRAVNDWTDPADAPDELISRLIYQSYNGVARAGQAFSAWTNPRPEVGEYREMLNHIKTGLNARLPSDSVLKCRKEFSEITGGRGANSIFNRIVSAFCPGVVSPVMFEDDFKDACQKLVRGGYIRAESIHEKAWEDSWYTRNVHLMEQLRQLLPDGPCEGARWPINDYTRGVFVWGVHADVNMEDWMILREHL